VMVLGLLLPLLLLLLPLDNDVCLHANEYVYETTSRARARKVRTSKLNLRPAAVR